VYQYEGEWAHDRRNGRGVLKTEAGVYDGQWKDDMVRGPSLMNGSVRSL